MMGRRKKWKVDLLSGRAAGLVLLGIFFLLGSTVGCICAGFIDDPGGMLLDYVRGYLTLLAQGDVAGRFLPILWEISFVPILVFVLGLTALGVVGLPALFAVRGFLLCYAVSAFYRLLGLRGLLPAFLLFGLSALIWLPVLFQLGVQGLLGAYGLLRRTMGDGRYPLRYNGGYLLCCGICVAALCLCAGVECLVTPVLLQKIAWMFGSG